MRTHNNSTRNSHKDFHEIDQSQFDNFVQCKQDAITIEFNIQLRHNNIMYDEISTKPALQHVLTDIHLKSMGSNQQWLKYRFKIDLGACGNIMSLSMYKSMYRHDPLPSTVDQAVRLLDYNHDEIKQLSTCHILARFGDVMKHVHFYIVCD